MSTLTLTTTHAGPTRLNLAYAPISCPRSSMQVCIPRPSAVPLSTTPFGRQNTLPTTAIRSQKPGLPSSPRPRKRTHSFSVPPTPAPEHKHGSESTSRRGTSPKMHRTSVTAVSIVPATSNTFVSANSRATRHQQHRDREQQLQHQHQHQQQRETRKKTSIGTAPRLHRTTSCPRLDLLPSPSLSDNRPRLTLLTAAFNPPPTVCTLSTSTSQSSSSSSSSTSTLAPTKSSTSSSLSPAPAITRKPTPSPSIASSPTPSPTTSHSSPRLNVSSYSRPSSPLRPQSSSSATKPTMSSPPSCPLPRTPRRMGKPHQHPPCPHGNVSALLRTAVLGRMRATPEGRQVLRMGARLAMEMWNATMELEKLVGGVSEEDFECEEEDERDSEGDIVMGDVQERSGWEMRVVSGYA